MSMFRIKLKSKKLTRAAALRLSCGKYWIMGREIDAFVLARLGIELGPKAVDKQGRVKRAKGLVVWGQCTIPNVEELGQYNKSFAWGPDCPDHVAKDLVRARVDRVLQSDGTSKDVPHEVSELDWDDESFRKKVGADKS